MPAFLDLGQCSALAVEPNLMQVELHPVAYRGQNDEKADVTGTCCRSLCRNHGIAFRRPDLFRSPGLCLADRFRWGKLVSTGFYGFMPCSLGHAEMVWI